MLARLKRMVVRCAPPILVDCYKSRFGPEGYFGDYPSYEEAVRISGRYSDEIVLEGIKKNHDLYAAGKIRPPLTSLALLSGLLKAFSNLGRLRVMDFGGSLGSTYFQFQDFLRDVPNLSWSVVELKSLAEYGKNHLETDSLRFFRNADECMKGRKPEVLILGGVLQYTKEPYATLDKLLAYGFEYVLLDRTLLTKRSGDFLKIQKIPRALFGRPTRYPAWVLSEEQLLRKFLGRYELVTSIKSPAPFSDERSSSNFMMFKRTT